MASTLKNPGKTNGRGTTETVRPSSGIPAVSKERHNAVRSSSTGIPTPTPGVTPQAIAEAAYFLWQQRGGDDLANWLDAEASLKARFA